MHTDFECFTIMHQNAPGLQVMHRNTGQWIDMNTTGGFIVIIGDMLERLSNGHLVATPHRVLRTSWPRQSIIRFTGLDGPVTVEPLEAMCSPSNPARFEPVTQAGWLHGEIAKGVANMDGVATADPRPH